MAHLAAGALDASFEYVMALTDEFESAVAAVMKVAERDGQFAREPGRIPVDVRILNQAPFAFCYHVASRRLLFSPDEESRVPWVERTVSRYLDIEPLRDRAIKEAMLSWS